VTFSDRVDVEESEVVFVLGYFVAGNFTCDNSAENRSHDKKEN
jgi:hypothetical protein